MLGRGLRQLSREVLGINRRNVEWIFARNPRARFPWVDDKIRTKELLEEIGLPTPRTLASVARRDQVSPVLERLHQEASFVVKPTRGFGGQGVLLLERVGDRDWRSAGGRALSQQDLAFHFHAILSGMFSLDHLGDRVLIEERLRDAPELADLHGGSGVSDLRVILADDRPAMAMLRLPCRRSGGTANLHAGGIGVGVDLETGRTGGGVGGGRPVSRHPDTGRELAGLVIPGFLALREQLRGLNEKVGMGFLGVDVALDAQRGPVILELNARPGLAIQLANRRGLRGALGGAPREGENA